MKDSASVTKSMNSDRNPTKEDVTVMNKVKLSVALTLYIAAIVAANVMSAHYGMVTAGFGLMVSAGTYAAGAALLLRDFVHKHGGAGWALAGIAAGGILSWFMSNPALAVASVVAFTGAELVDLAVFAPLKTRIGFVRTALLSNLVSAPLDTVIFLYLSGFGVTLPSVMGQLLGKIVWATVIPLSLYIAGRYAVQRKTATA